MSSVISLPLQRPPFMPIPVVRTAVQRSVSVGPARKSPAPEPRTPQLAASCDLSFISPDAAIASSQTLGWQNLHAVELRHETAEWTMPPMDNHCVIIQLGSAVAVAARIGNHTFEKVLSPGEIVIVPARMPLNWRQQNGVANDTLHLYLHPNFLRTTAEEIGVDDSQISIAPQFGVTDEHIHHIAMSLQCELQDASVNGRAYGDSLAKVLAMQLVRRYSYLKDLHISRGGMAPRKLRKAIEFINENLDQEQTVGLAAVAETVQMSYFHFSRVFKQSTGVSPNVYMTQQRIERAKKLLSETDLPIADIALRTGFASQSHFTTTFRKLVWTTPKAFRQMI